MNAPVKIEVQEPVSVEAAAKAAMQGEKSFEDGAKRLLTMAREDAGLMAALMGPYESRAAYDAVRKGSRHLRRVIWDQSTTHAANGRVGALVAANMAMLLEFPLPGGKPLRDATRDEVQDAADLYRKQAVDMVQKAAWLRLVAKNVPTGKTVGETLDELALALFKEETKNG